MSAHLTPDELRQFLQHRLPPARIGAAARHIAQCPACAATARESYDVAAAGRAVGEGLGSDIAAEERPSRPYLAIAAAVAACLIGLTAWLAHTPPTSPPTSLPARAAEGDRWTRIAAAARAEGRVAMPDVLRALRPPDGSLRGTEGTREGVRLSPAGIVVDEDRPSLRWDAVPHATSYRVLLFRGTTQIGESAPLTRRSWRPEHPLDRGATYEWQLTAKLPHGEVAIPAPPAPPTLFRVLSQHDHDELEAARRAHPDDGLLLGLLDARAGLADRATEELGAFAAAHPGDRQAQALWRSVTSCWQTRN